VRGFDGSTVRGVIAQQVRSVMPEYVSVAPMSFPEKNFDIPDFLEVDKLKITIDLLAALQAQQRRLTVGAHAPERSGSVAISTAAALLAEGATDAA
jgi:mucin-19